MAGGGHTATESELVKVYRKGTGATLNTRDYSALGPVIPMNTLSLKRTESWVRVAAYDLSIACRHKLSDVNRTQLICLRVSIIGAISVAERTWRGLAAIPIGPNLPMKVISRAMPADRPMWP